MIICNGRGDNGGHCCVINGEVCGFLFTDRGGTPRCSLFDEWGRLADNPEWVAAPVGRWFAEQHPGYDCGDWPQNIPEVMAEVESGRVNPTAVCCWKVKFG